ncbi:MAG: hypothetical protein EHM20_17490 [Alphaproteobacteria bacterium]|nr:MAG: hypothetical protein EHM20_17490 [Alphaproteobacteria bacterium]
MEPKTNEFGHKYYDKLPETAVIAVREDLFDMYFRLRYGKYYLLESHDGKSFFIKQCTIFTNTDRLVDYINSNQVYVAQKDKVK